MCCEERLILLLGVEKWLVGAQQIIGSQQQTVRVPGPKARVPADPIVRAAVARSQPPQRRRRPDSTEI
jgi:hypothetical protein